MRAKYFSRLFSPGYINVQEIRNRTVLAPMGTSLEDEDGNVSQKLIDYFVARAKGGTGLIIVGGLGVNKLAKSKQFSAIPALESEKGLEGAMKLVASVHACGAKIGIQTIAGAGRQEIVSLPEKVPVAPSAVPAFMDPNVNCRVMTREEIKEIVEAHANAARRIMMAGFDMIEFHAHTGYLIDEFMTPLWNRRTDEYGGDIDGRMRFPLKIIQAVRTVVGSDFPLSFRLTGDHKIPGGRTINESIEIARRLEAAGIDVLHVDAGCYDSMPWIFPPDYYADGCFVDLAAEVKKNVNIPVIAVGNIKRPELAEKILEGGHADFIALGRQLIADPDWVIKSRDGCVAEIRPCIGCNEYCTGRLLSQQSISCSVNPQVGKERFYEATNIEKTKKVIVVGGGPAGMEAARVAALRGHEVTLYEKENKLGGQLNAASKPPFKVYLEYLVNYLSIQLNKLGVKIKLETEITPQMLNLIRPDVIIVATGAHPLKPSIQGIENDNIMTAIDLHTGKKRIGETIIVAGGGLTGCDTALTLAQKGKKITIVEMMPEIARDLNIVSRQALLEELVKAGVTILTNLIINEFKATGLVAVDKYGQKKELHAETVVLAMGSESDKLAESLKGKAKELYTIGDCRTPRKVGEAIHEGFVTGWQI